MICDVILFCIHIRPLIFLFDRFHTSHYVALCNLLFGVSIGPFLKTVLWPIMVIFYKFWLGCKVVSWTLTPQLLLSVSSYIRTSPVYGVNISRYSIACSCYSQFLKRRCPALSKEFFKKKSRSISLNVIGKYQDLIDIYSVSTSQLKMVFSFRF